MFLKASAMERANFCLKCRWGVWCLVVIFYIFEYRAEYGASILFNSGFM